MDLNTKKKIFVENYEILISEIPGYAGNMKNSGFVLFVKENIPYLILS